MINAAYWYFVLNAIVALILVYRRWWVWLSLAAPVLIFLVCSAFIAPDAAAAISFLGVVPAAAAVSEIVSCLVRVVQAMRKPSPEVQPD
jgi:biotin transporter BioY